MGRWGRVALPAIVSAVVLALGYAGLGVSQGYSYWLDEIASVTASASSWGAMYRGLLADVHPPLYQMVLKLWVGPWGTSEAATRSLSLLFAATTLTLFAREAFRSRRNARRVALLLVGVSPALLYYAQETRAYSMALALASFVTLLALRIREADGADDPHTERRRWLLHAGALALTLTHYFGWIYVFVLSAIHLVERRIEPRRGRILLVLGTMALWPLWHVAVGGLGKTTGGNFWITVAPVVGTVRNYFVGCLLPLYVSMRTTLALVGAAVAAIVILSLSARARSSDPAARRSAARGESRYLLVAVLGMVVLTGAVDLHTPMSTPRNFIVLLPATVLLIGNLFEALAGPGWRGPRGVAATLGTVAIAFALARQAHAKVVEKTTPLQNWKGLATYVGEAGICGERCLVFGGGDLHRYYFDRARFPNVDFVPPGEIEPRLEELRTSARDVPVLGFHDARAIPGLAELESDGGRVCLQPEQSDADAAFVLLPRARATGDPGARGMRPCGG